MRITWAVWDRIRGRGGLLEPLFIGILTGLTAAAGVFYWHLLVSPERVLVLFGDLSDEWFEEAGGGALRALVWVSGLVVFLCASVTGVAVVFFASTL